MKLSRIKQPKRLGQYRTHHEIDIDEDEELVVVYCDFLDFNNMSVDDIKQFGKQIHKDNVIVVRNQNLTEEGNRVLTWALQITADARTMKEEIQNRTKGLSGTLIIGAIPTAMPAIPEITNSFLNRHIGITKVHFNNITFFVLHIDRAFLWPIWG